MTITTTPNIEGRPIREYLGLVSSCVLVAFPGNAKMFKRGWDAGIEAATSDIEEQASQLNADAIVGVKIDVIKSGVADYMYITGTAVSLE